MDSKDRDTKISKTSSESVGLSSIGFLALPDGARKNIYETLLAVSHPIYLFQDPGSPVGSFAPDKPLHWLALLYTNRRVSAEASAVLYRVNHFELVDITKLQTEALRSFLNCIGSTNAASLSYLCINFPMVISLDDNPSKYKLTEDSLQTLILLQDNCKTLSTVETVVHYKNSGFFARSDDFLQEALRVIDVQLSAIPSLKRVLVRVEVQDGVPTSSTKDMMQRLGWLVLPCNES